MSQMQWRDEGNVTFLQRGKRGILRIIFGRTMLLLLILAAQILGMIAFVLFLRKDIPYLFAGVFLFRLIMVIVALNSQDNPMIKLSWVIVMLLSPMIGVFLYVFVRRDVGHRRVHAALEEIDRQTERYVPKPSGLMERLETEEPELYELAEYLMGHGGYPVFAGTAVKYFPIGEAMFEEMLAQLEAAKSFIFMEYFIVDEGYMWGRILNILERKAKEGVEVRVMYDGMCAIALLPYDYPKRLEKLGIKSKMFAPILPFVSTHYNNRDHRKILVIDGNVAFTGGINLADEYINRKKPYGHWKDTAVMLRGDAVKSFTLMFLRMWNGDRNIKRYRVPGTQLPEDSYEYYLGAGQGAPQDASGYVIPYGDTPYDDEQVGEMVYLDIINRANRYVHIMTPYLILDNETVTALVFAAKRGVDVKMILPHIPDKKYAFALAKTHYRQLIGAGVHIFEYTPGFVHAKVFVADGIRGVVGTVNLDYRSLYLHFECAAYLHRVRELADVEADFVRTLKLSHEVTMEEAVHQKLSTRIAGNILKLVAPLM